jgi:opacity protein-like surface antigen
VKKTALLGLLLLPFLSAIPSWGQPTNLHVRAGKWEVYGLGLYDHVTPGGVGVDVYAGGVGIGYNFIDQLGAYVEFTAGSASAAVDSASGSASAYAGEIGLNYNILKKPLTPFVTVGLEYLRFTSDGTYRGFFGPYVGLGARWDFNERWFAKAEYRLSSMVTMFGVNGDDNMTGNGIFLSAGLKF